MAEIREAILRAYEYKSHHDTGRDGEQGSGPCCYRCVEMFDVKLNPKPICISRLLCAVTATEHKIVF